ncbi:hypothetical protein I552_8618 [Mycobacterium xenopi 3993]|nr:hypothetical protein I552_8618 [Mycobacterium xenopi 3993]
MEILQILKANNVPLNRMVDVRSNPVLRQQIQAVVRRAASQAAQPTAAARRYRRRAQSIPHRNLRSVNACRSWKACTTRARSPTRSTRPSAHKSSPKSEPNRQPGRRV